MHIHGDEREPDIPLSPDSVTIHEFAIVPIELYGDHVARTKQESLGNKLREEPGWGREDAPQDDFASLEHLVDLDLLRELGIEVRRDRYARSMNDLENEGAPYSEYLFFFDRRACRLYYRTRVVDLRSFSVDWAYGENPQLRASERSDALRLATTLHLWFGGGFARWSSKLSQTGDTITAELLGSGRERKSQIEDLISQDQSLRYFSPFSVVVIGEVSEDASLANPQSENATEAFRATLDALRLLDMFDYIGTLSEDTRSAVLAICEGRLRADLLELTVNRRDSEDLYDLLRTIFVSDDFADLNRDIRISLERYTRYQQEENAGWRELRDGNNQLWLRSGWDTSVLVTTNREHLGAFAALEIGLESVWNSLDLRARNLPEVLTDKRDDIDGDESLRALSRHALQVAGWWRLVSGWQRAVLDQLRLEYRLDENVDVFLKVSAEYTRYEAVTREREAQKRTQKFQGAFTIAGVSLAALVLGEITISIAAANAGTARVVSEAVGWIAFPLVAVVTMWLAAWLFHGLSRPWPQWRIWLSGLVLSIWVVWQLSVWQSETTEFGLPLPTVPLPILDKDLPLSWVAWPLGVLVGLLVVLVAFWAFLFARRLSQKTYVRLLRIGRTKTS